MSCVSFRFVASGVIYKEINKYLLSDDDDQNVDFNSNLIAFSLHNDKREQLPGGAKV